MASYIPCCMKKLVAGSTNNQFSLDKCFVVVEYDEVTDNLKVSDDYGHVMESGVYEVDENFKMANIVFAKWKLVSYDKTTKVLASVSDADVANFIHL